MSISNRTTLTILFLLLLGTPEVLQANGRGSAAGAQTRAKRSPVANYACPMHPEVTSTRPRKCPKCGMTLRRVKKEMPAVAPAAAPAAASDAPLSPSTDTGTTLQIPDVEVFDQNGKRLKFSSDLIKGKTVAINFIFTTCTAICPSLTATFRRVQQELEAQKLPAELISISVDPTTDTPERLRDFAAKFKAGPGWTFVTGDKTAIDSILRALGTTVAVKTDHTPMVLIGNERSGYWVRTYGLSSPSSMIKVIAEAAGKK